jgi:hypothetical protein
MQLANVANVANMAPVAKRRIRSIQEEHKVPRQMERQVFILYCMMGLAHFCLICQKTVNCFQLENLERHFKSHIAHFDTTHPSQSNLRNIRIIQPKGQLKGQQQMMDRSGTVAEKTTEAA